MHKPPDAAPNKRATQRTWPRLASLLCASYLEVKSPSNSMPELRAKCRMYIQCGALEAWLIHPAQKLVEVYLPEGTVREYRNVEEVSATASELQSFVLDLTPIWAGL